MTEGERKRLEEVLAHMTDGPWYVEGAYSHTELRGPGGALIVRMNPSEVENADRNLSGIAVLRTMVPQLLETLDAVQSSNALLVEQLQSESAELVALRRWKAEAEDTLRDLDLRLKTKVRKGGK